MGMQRIKQRDVAFTGDAKGTVNALGGKEFNEGFGGSFHGLLSFLAKGIAQPRRMIHGAHAENRYKPSFREAFIPGRTPNHAD
jgi:hypothetical protein